MRLEQRSLEVRGLSYQISNGGVCEWEKSAREMIRS